MVKTYFHSRNAFHGNGFCEQGSANLEEDYKPSNVLAATSCLAVRCNRARRYSRRHAESRADGRDRKSTRLNSSHLVISYAVFCLKKKNESRNHTAQEPEA